MIRVSLLGGLQVEADGKVLSDFPRRKAAALLALLALAPRQRHAREELAARLWPDADAETGRASLRQALVLLNRATLGLTLVRADPQALQLAEGVTTDVADFEAAHRTGDAAWARTLWRGELLPGFFEETILVERERLNALKDSLPAERVVAISAPRSLPIYLSEFHGRSEELESLAEALASPSTRLVTLLGPGGVGKTRLAVALAAGVKREAAFVDLAALPTEAGEDLLLQAVADALALAPSEGEPWASSLPRQLAPRSLLLLLDNAEHVLEGATALALRLLAAAPRLQLLVTSREPLRIPGERDFLLGPLKETEAKALLFSAARAVRADLPDDPGAVSFLCERLDGLPLALELAASQCRTLSLREVADDLGGAISLPASPGTARPERHRSLAAALAWSEALLTPDQRRLLARLSVFVGGAEREAILSVCEASRNDLAALVEKSLVGARVGAGGATRYRFLEPVRQWAAERLRESGDEASVLKAHARWYLEFAERAGPELRRAAQHDWLKRLDAERANLYAALNYLSADDSLRLGLALRQYWQRAGLLDEGLRLTDRALAAAPASPRWRTAAQLTRGTLLASAGRAPEAQECFRAAAKSSGREISREAALFLTLSMSPTFESYLEAARPFLERTGDADRWLRAQALLQVEGYLDGLDDRDRKQEMLAEAATLFEEEGDLHKAMEALYILVGIHLIHNRFSEAAPLLERLQETAAHLESVHIEVLTLSMQMRVQRALPQTDSKILASLADRLAVLAPRVSVPHDAYNAWHDLLQAARHLARWRQAELAMVQMLHFRQKTLLRPIQGVYLLGAVGSLMADTGQTERGGLLYGYMTEARGRLGALPNELEIRVYERDLACLRAPDPAGLESALTAGRSLTFEEALAAAQQPLGVLPPDGTPPLLPPI